MNNLDRAKELKEKINYLRNSKIENSVIFTKELFKLIKEAKQLKQKVEKGCGEQFEMGEEFPALCTKEDGIYDTWYCENCQETLKILEEILE